MIDTYLMRRPSRIGTAMRARGELVPEAHTWRLVDGMVRSGRLVKTRASEADFAAAVARFCPDDANAIYLALGLTPVETPTTTRTGRPKGKRTVVATAPTLIEV